MNVLVTGASGFIGRALCRALLARGDRVVGLTRDVERGRHRVPSGVRLLPWNPLEVGEWARELSEIDAIVHLAAIMPIEKGRMSRAELEELACYAPKMLRTLEIALGQQQRRPTTLLSASAITVYGERGDEILSEQSRLGDDYMARGCAEIEGASQRLAELGLRTCELRFGFVLERGGGPLTPVIPMFRFFLGATIGDPGQWISWIHMDDAVGMMLYALDHEECRGPHNLTAPHPVQAREFFSEIGRAMRRPCWLPLPRKLVLTMMGETGLLLLTSQRVIPKRGIEAGYEFRHRFLAPALDAIFGHP